jgi:hypothetical protein
MMMEAASTSETSVNFYETTRRNNPEDIHLHTRHRENPKSEIIIRFNGAHTHTHADAKRAKNHQRFGRSAFTVSQSCVENENTPVSQ